MNSLQHVMSRRMAGIILAITSNAPDFNYVADDLIRKLRRLHPAALCTTLVDALRWESARLKMEREKNSEVLDTGVAADSLSFISKRVASRFITFDAQYA